jgi:hypothetical protein
VHFHSLFPGTQVSRDLFVESATNDVFHYLPLTSRKRLNAQFDCATNCGRSALGSFEPERSVDSGEETHAVDRLRQIVDCARLHGAHTSLYLASSGEKDYRVAAL